MSSANVAPWAFLVDEDMSRSLAPALRTAGYDAIDVRDVGLRMMPLFSPMLKHINARSLAKI